MKYKILSNRTNEFKEFNNFTLTKEEIRARKAHERSGFMRSITTPLEYNNSWYDRELNKFNAYVNHHLSNGYEPYGELKYFETEEKEGVIVTKHRVFMQTLVKRTCPPPKRKQFHEEGNRPMNPPQKF